jgi:hypothetical protein
MMAILNDLDAVSSKPSAALRALILHAKRRLANDGARKWSGRKYACKNLICVPAVIARPGTDGACLVGTGMEWWCPVFVWDIFFFLFDF